MSLIALKLFLAALLLSSLISAFFLGFTSTIGSAILVSVVTLSFLVTILDLSLPFINVARSKAAPILPTHALASDVTVFCPTNAPAAMRSVQRVARHDHQRHPAAPITAYPTFFTASSHVDALEQPTEHIRRMKDASMAANNTSIHTFTRPTNPMAADLNSIRSDIVASHQPTPSVVSISDSLPSVDSIVRRVSHKFDIVIASPAPTLQSDPLPSVDALIRRVRRSIAAGYSHSRIVSAPSNIDAMLRPTNPMGEMLSSPSGSSSTPSRNPLRIVGVASAPSDDSPIPEPRHRSFSISSSSHPNFVPESRHRSATLGSGPSTTLSFTSTPRPWTPSGAPKTSTDIRELERVDEFYRRKYSRNASFDSPSHPNFVPEPLHRSSALDSGPSTPLSFSSTPRPWVPSSVANRWPRQPSPSSADSPVASPSCDSPASLSPSLSLRQWAPALLLDSALRMPEPIRLLSLPSVIVRSPILTTTASEGDLFKDEPGNGVDKLWRRLRRTTSEVPSKLPA